MIEVKKLVEVQYAETSEAYPPPRKSWVATYLFRGVNGKVYYGGGCMTSVSPEACARIAYSGTTIPGTVRVFEIPPRD